MDRTQPMPEVPCRPVMNVNLWLTLHINHSGCDNASERAVAFAMAQFMSWGDNGGGGCYATPEEIGRTACLTKNTAQTKRSALRSLGWLMPSYRNGRSTVYACAVPDTAYQEFQDCLDHARCAGEMRDQKHLARVGPLWLPTPFDGGGVPRFTGEGSPAIWGTNSPMNVPKNVPLDSGWTDELPY